jgi:minor extracellular protease Epr
VQRRNMSRFYRTMALAVLCLPGATAHAQLGLPSVNDTLNQLPTRDVTEGLNRELERKKKTAEELARDTADRADKLAIQAAGLVVGLLRPVLYESDPHGARIEFNTIAVMVDNDTLAAIIAQGFDLMSKRELPALGLTLATLRNSDADTLPEAVQKLRSKYPHAVIDFNHIYEFAAQLTAESVLADGPEATGSTTNQDFAKLRIGIIDSAVQSEHPALAGIRVDKRDFAIGDGHRPLTHGTAVASLVAGSAHDNVDILAASVFVQIDGYAPGASTESLVAALDWLASENVDVINMSLAGPGNALLKAAIAGLQESGPPVVAAVGNNGPSGDPLYPAAYDGTIGVTAVDRRHRIFRYANRGEYVDFAALGVDVRVADSISGGWRVESGTSMASPYVAVLVAQIARDSDIERNALTSWLMASATDLGKKGHDKVFGYGLLAQVPGY